MVGLALVTGRDKVCVDGYDTALGIDPALGIDRWLRVTSRYFTLTSLAVSNNNCFLLVVPVVTDIVGNSWVRPDGDWDTVVMDIAGNTWVRPDGEFVEMTIFFVDPWG